MYCKLVLLGVYFSGGILMKKTKRILISSTLIIIGIVAYIIIANAINTSIVKKLAAFGEEQFISIDFESYMDRLRKQGLNDLSAEVSTYYNYEYDYDKNSKTLRLSCRLEMITSNKIDNYFTTEYNGSNGSKLARLMEAIKNVYSLECKYTTDSGETVIVSIAEPDHYVTIHTSSGRVYEYVFGFIDSVRVEIDGDWVYCADVEPTSEPYHPGLFGGECKLSHCDSKAKEGSNYCHRHGCCEDGCTNEKDPSAHCCNTHNCKHPGCGAHRYEYIDSKYCQAHYDEH